LAREGVHVAIRLRPGAKANRVVAVAPAARGRQELIASVTEPPRNGRANEALLRLLAGAWQLRRRDLSVVAGAAGRHKVVQITGNPKRLLADLARAIALLPSAEEAGR
jgi:uncharacterized protein (TIGR00251 family)